jgi:regulator of replication initiation timing
MEWTSMLEKVVYMIHGLYIDAFTNEPLESNFDDPEQDTTTKSKRATGNNEKKSKQHNKTKQKKNRLIRVYMNGLSVSVGPFGDHHMTRIEKFQIITFNQKKMQRK